MVSSMGDVATMFERVAATEAAYEQQFNQLVSTNAQVQQQINQQATINSQLNTHNQDTAREVSNLRQTVQDLQARVNSANQSRTGTGRKPLCESRSVANLKTLGSKKEDFKNWNERLINSTTQVFGPEWRKFIKHLNEKLDLGRKILTVSELGQLPFANQIPEPHRCNEELYYLMVEKTEGDAALRVNSGNPGEGMQAYMRVYLWFAGTTGLALTEKTRMLMHPTPPKHEYEIADALEKWLEQERTLRAHGKDYELNVAFKITALKIIMSCKREHFENMERECKTRHGDMISEAMFTDLLARIREYAQQRRLE